jgi:late competence protein required for DNA uptake (superfamily II DNA/RNA helicase)
MEESSKNTIKKKKMKCCDCKKEMEEEFTIVDRGYICRECFEAYKKLIYERSKNNNDIKSVLHNSQE